MSRHLQALDKALSSILPACRLNLAQSSLFTTVPTEIAAASSKLAGLAFRAAGDVAAGKQPAGNAHDVVERHRKALEDTLQSYCSNGSRPSAEPEQRQLGAYRLEVLSCSAASLLVVSHACWQRAQPAPTAPGSSAGSSSGSAGSSSGGASGEHSEAALAQLCSAAAGCMDALLVAWCAAVSLALRTMQAMPRTGRRGRERSVDPALRVATCALGAVHAALTHVNTVPSTGGAAEQRARYSFGNGALDLGHSAYVATSALELFLSLAPPEELDASPGPGHKPFPVWGHAAAVVLFLEQANRLLPLLQWATEGGGRGAVQGSRDELSELFNLLPTCCSMLCFMMTDQAPQHGDGSPELERSLASMAATGAKLARFLEATQYRGRMWQYLYPAMGICMSWIGALRLAQGGPSAEEQDQVWRGMHQPTGKVAALVHVYAEAWPLAQRHQVGGTFNEEAALAAALLANVAGLPMARCGGMKVVARQLQLHKETLSLDFLFRVAAALRYAGEAETELYCWYARDAVLEALAAVGAELARWPIAAQHAQQKRSLVQDYIYSITLRTARKADELTGSHLEERLEHWLEQQLLRHLSVATMQAQPTYWRGLLRTHVPAILAALRRAPDGGCRPVAPAEAAAQRDRACAWLGCGNPGCLNLAGASEAALPVLRCARCRVVGYCGPACQRAAWAHHKPACELLSRPSDEA